jgi:hypothetical protein
MKLKSETGIQARGISKNLIECAGAARTGRKSRCDPERESSIIRHHHTSCITSWYCHTTERTQRLGSKENVLSMLKQMTVYSRCTSFLPIRERSAVLPQCQAIVPLRELKRSDTLRHATETFLAADASLESCLRCGKFSSLDGCDESSSSEGCWTMGSEMAVVGGLLLDRDACLACWLSVSEAVSSRPQILVFGVPTCRYA